MLLLTNIKFRTLSSGVINISLALTQKNLEIMFDPKSIGNPLPVLIKGQI